MLLDCDAATLTVYVNGERKGVMVQPGMTDTNGEPVGRLEGPLRWAVDLQGDPYQNLFIADEDERPKSSTVKIDGPLPLPA